MKLLWLMGAGALGTLARYGLMLLANTWTARHTNLFGVANFPLGTIVVNVLGCFLMGMVLALFLRSAISPDLRLIVGVGFLGSFTTFSAFELEAESLLGQGLWPAATAYIAGNLLLGFIAILLGRALVLRVVMPAV